jgi:hypothetical protein
MMVWHELLATDEVTPAAQIASVGLVQTKTELRAQDAGDIGELFQGTTIPSTTIHSTGPRDAIPMFEENAALAVARPDGEARGARNT